MAQKKRFAWKKGSNVAPLVAEASRGRKQRKGKVTFTGMQGMFLLPALKTFLEVPDGYSDASITRFLRKAMFAATSNGKLTPKTIINSVRGQATAYLRKEPDTFYLVTSLSYRGKPPLDWAKIDDARVYFRFNARRFYGAGKRGDDRRVERLRDLGVRPQEKEYRPVAVRVFARTQEEAFENGMRALNEIRGMINLFYNQKVGFRITSGRRQPHNSLRLGPIHTIHDEQGFCPDDLFWYEPDFVEPQQIIDLGKDYSSLRKYLERVRRLMLRSVIADDIGTAIIRYVGALDHPDWGVSFRELWALLEFLTDTQGESYDKTVRRMASLWSEYEFSLEMAKHLRDRRNRQVHAAADDSDTEMLMIQARHFVERLLGLYLRNEPGFRSRTEVGKFLELPRSTTELRRTSELARAAIELRSRQQGS